MEGRGPETSQGSRTGRGLDMLVWVATLAGVLGLAAAVGWALSNMSFAFREAASRDETAESEALIPVAPAPESARPEAPTADAALPEGASASGVVAPKWIRQPAPLYPALAASRGVSRGEVALKCEALASGELGACEVLRETPPGVGFAEAALDSTRQARVTPRSIDGFRTDSTIRFTVRFLMVE